MPSSRTWQFRRNRESPGSRKIVADELEKFLKEREACLNDLNRFTKEAAINSLPELKF